MKRLQLIVNAQKSRFLNYWEKLIRRIRNAKLILGNWQQLLHYHFPLQSLYKSWIGFSRKLSMPSRAFSVSKQWMKGFYSLSKLDWFFRFSIRESFQSFWLQISLYLMEDKIFAFHCILWTDYLFFKILILKSKKTDSSIIQVIFQKESKKLSFRDRASLIWSCRYANTADSDFFLHYSINELGYKCELGLT